MILYSHDLKQNSGIAALNTRKDNEFTVLEM